MADTELKIDFVERLCDFTTLTACVDDMMRKAMAEGSIAVDRSEPTEDAHCAYVGSMAQPMAVAVFYDVGQGRLWLDLLLVKPAFRKSGLGNALIDFVEAHARQLGYVKVCFGTGITNEPMRQLAAANYYTATAVIMEKTIAGAA